jgi:hypothetical protein
LSLLYGKAARFAPRSLLTPGAEAVGRMSVPLPGQTVHLMNWCNVLRMRHHIEGRNKLELQLYTTDDLRRRYQENGDDLIRLAFSPAPSWLLKSAGACFRHDSAMGWCWS